jgi:preprotein translocase subunit YajC
MLLAVAKSSSSLPLIPIEVALLGAFYFFYVRPRSRKAKAAREEARQVETGDVVQTIGGLVGTVVKRTDSLVTIRTNSGVELDFVPKGIGGKYEAPSAPAPAAPAPTKRTAAKRTATKKND